MDTSANDRAGTLKLPLMGAAQRNALSPTTHLTVYVLMSLVPSEQKALSFRFSTLATNAVVPSASYSPMDPNGVPPTCTSAAGNEIARDVHPLKELLPIDMRVSGIVISESEVHPSKAESIMLFVL